jgi:peroxiredoxin
MLVKQELSMKNFRNGLSVLALTVTAVCLIGVTKIVLASPAIGQAAPDFSLPDALNGNSVSLQSLISSHKAAVIIFDSIDCPYCQAYVSRMLDLATKYGTLGVSVVAIDSNVTEQEADVVAYKFVHRLTFPILMDDSSKVARAYGATHTPECFVIDTNGNIVYHGRIDNSVEVGGVKTRDLANALDDILAGKPVAEAETKAFGCSIKEVQEN